MGALSPQTSAFWMLTGNTERVGRKVKSDAVLKNLRPEAQELVFEWCCKPSERDSDGKALPGTGGTAFAREQLAGLAEKLSLAYLRVSERALSEFYSFFGLKLDLRKAANAEELYADFKPGAVKEAREFGELLFTKLGIARQDKDTFAVATMSADSRARLELDRKSATTRAEIAFAKLTQKDRDHLLAREKFEFDAAKAVLAKLAELKTIARDRALSEDDKIAQVRLRLWGPAPKLLEGSKE